MTLSGKDVEYGVGSVENVLLEVEEEMHVRTWKETGWGSYEKHGVNEMAIAWVILTKCSVTIGMTFRQLNRESVFIFQLSNNPATTIALSRYLIACSTCCASCNVKLRSYLIGAVQSFMLLLFDKAEYLYCPILSSAAKACPLEFSVFEEVRSCYQSKRRAR